MENGREGDEGREGSGKEGGTEVRSGNRVRRAEGRLQRNITEMAVDGVGRGGREGKESVRRRGEERKRERGGEVRE